MKRPCRHETQHQIFVNGEWVYWCCACGALKIGKWPKPGHWTLPGPALVKRAEEDVRALKKSERKRKREEKKRAASTNS